MTNAQTVGIMAAIIWTSQSIFTHKEAVKAAYDIYAMAIDLMDEQVTQETTG
jgi:hypothetical protein